MERVRLDAIRFFILPYPAASQACVWGMRGAIRTAQKVGRRFRRANRLRRQNERARVLTSPTESSVAIPEDQEERGSG